jgi:hypothetical protein
MKETRMSKLLSALMLLALTGCASIIGDKMQSMSVNTVLDNKEVAGVGCTLSNDAGSWFVSSPGSVTVHKSTGDLAVTCKREGVAGDTQAVSRANKAVWGNILFGGIIGYVVDRSTGAGFDYPTNMTVSLRQYGEPGAVQAALVDASGNQIEVIPFRAGVSSTTVERMAKAAGCNGGKGAGLLTPQGPVEVYKMQCENGSSYKARCEMRQCVAM